MRPPNQDELAWLERRNPPNPHGHILAYLDENPGWAHLELTDFPTVGPLEDKQQALLREAEIRGLLLQIEVRPGNPAGGIFVRVLKRIR